MINFLKLEFLTPVIFLSIFLNINIYGQIDSENFPTLLFIGDSLTEGYGVPKSDSYPNQLERMLIKSGYPKTKAINGGSSGATTAFGFSLLNFQLSKSTPDIVIYALGSNDMLRGVAIQKTKENIQQTIKSLNQKKIPILLLGQRSPPNYGNSYSVQFSKIFEELGSIPGVTLVPFLLKGIAGEASLNISDGIHPNKLGHKKIAERIYTPLNNLIVKLKPKSETHGKK